MSLSILKLSHRSFQPPLPHIAKRFAYTYHAKKKDPVFQNFHHWLYSTFSNEPHVLGRYSGYFKGVQAFGTATAFGIDSRRTPLLNQGAAYFPLMIVGLGLSALAAYQFTTETNYGAEQGVVVPAAVEREVGIKTDAQTLREVGIPVTTASNQEIIDNKADNI